MTLYAKIDCSFPDDPKVIEAGPMAELLYLRMVLHCREHLTDGVVNRAHLSRIATGLRTKDALVRRLLDTKLLEEHQDGWRIPVRVWRRWNPTKAAVAKAAAVKSEAGTLGNHERWHQSNPNPNCPLCIANASQHATNGHRTIIAPSDGDPILQSIADDRYSQKPEAITDEAW